MAYWEHVPNQIQNKQRSQIQLANRLEGHCQYAILFIQSVTMTQDEIYPIR